MYRDGICRKVDLCQKGENPFLIHEFEQSFFVVGDHQFYKGYGLLLLKDHIREIHEMEKEAYLKLCEELYVAEAAISNTFKPWKINIQCIGNQDPHIHWHIFPRYESDKYHRSLPMTDFTKGELKLEDFLIGPEEAKKVANEIKINLKKLV